MVIRVYQIDGKIFLFFLIIFRIYLFFSVPSKD